MYIDKYVQRTTDMDFDGNLMRTSTDFNGHVLGDARNDGTRAS